MTLQDHALTSATVATQLDCVVSAFPEESREGVRELMLAMASLMASLDRRLRADVDAEFVSCRRPGGICVLVGDSSEPQR